MEFMPMPLMTPSGSTAFHRSQMVVAPMFTSYSQLGRSSCSSKVYAVSLSPHLERARHSTGVPRKPVFKCISAPSSRDLRAWRFFSS